MPTKVPIKERPTAAQIETAARMLGDAERPRYPFGLEGPFIGVHLTDAQGGPVYDYEPQPRQYFAHNCCADEIFFGGGVYGGKTWWAENHVLMHCLAWGKDANTIILRRTFPMLEKSIIQEVVIPRWHGKLGNYNADKHVFFWNNGAKTWFGHIERWADIYQYDSAQFTLVAFEELTQFEERMYQFMFSRLRSPYNPDIHPQMISTSNPGGLGHRWVADKFVENHVSGEIYEAIYPAQRLPSGKVLPEQHVQRIYIQSTYTDNEKGLAADPGYVARMLANMDDRQIRAKMKADWRQCDGLAFPEFDKELHMVKSFPIPPDWKVIRSLDWGYSAPFSVGWWTRSPQDGTIYRIDEIYGAKRGAKGGVTGLKKSPDEVRRVILNREDAMVGMGHYPQPQTGPADSAIWASLGGEKSIGFLINEGGTLFRPAQKGPGSRDLALACLHSLLRINEDTGKPGVLIFEHCTESKRQLEYLALDEDDAEKVDSLQEDHIYDEWGYALIAMIGKRAATQRTPPLAWFEQQAYTESLV